MTILTTQEPNAIKEQLKQILSSPGFKKSYILSDFLSYVVNETLDGREKYIKEYVIATEVLHKKSDFNPQLDAIVRIHARRLRKALDDYYTSSSKNDQLVISIPKGSYVPKNILSLLWHL